MQIRTFTNFWNFEKKVYSIYDIQLPVAISLRQLGVFLLVGGPYWLLLNIFGVPFEINFLFLILWLGPPLAASVLGNRPIFEGKTLIQYLSSRVKFIFESKNHKGLSPATEKYGNTVKLKEQYYTRKP
jgi:hypothetical protein